jgi:hypothetical protein
MLKRVLGPGKAKPQRQLGVWLVLPEGHEIDVVGESYHQKELQVVLSAVGTRTRTAAVLSREPTNPYDPNAVAVALFVPGTPVPLTIGHLSRDLAPVFGRQLRRLEELGYRGAGCEATLEAASSLGRGISTPIGVVLNIASKRQVQKYLTAVTKNRSLDPGGFADEPESAVYQEESAWEVPGWIEETDS